MRTDNGFKQITQLFMQKIHDRCIARLLQRMGGGGSHCVKLRVLTRLSCQFGHLLWVVCFKKAYKRGVRGHGSWVPRTPLAKPLHDERLKLSYALNFINKLLKCLSAQ